MQNGAAITDALDDVISRLQTLRTAVEEGDVAELQGSLERARDARVSLPSSAPSPVGLAEVRVRIKDESGQLAAITGLAAELDVNIYDLEIAHSAEGPTGVIVILVNVDSAQVLKDGLTANGYLPSIRALS